MTKDFNLYVSMLVREADKVQRQYAQDRLFIKRSDALAIATMNMLVVIRADQARDNSEKDQAASDDWLAGLFAIGNRAWNGGIYLAFITRAQEMIDEARQYED